MKKIKCRATKDLTKQYDEISIITVHKKNIKIFISLHRFL